MLRRIYSITICLLSFYCLRAQDSHFSQFFSSPLTISPAMTGSIDADWRIAGNYRKQWAGPAAPFNTATISYDTKLLQNKLDGNTLGFGVLMMYDESFYKIVKSTYASAFTAYHQVLDDDGFQHIGVGFGATYGHRTISFNQLTWEEQLTNTGFNTNLPTGETSLSNMKAYVSLSTGMLYSYDGIKTIFEIGASCYHINKPKQTFLNDANQTVPMRYVIHADFNRLFNDQLTFVNMNTIFQHQANIDYVLAGAFIGRILDADEYTNISAGLFYRNSDAIIPMISLYRNGWQLGLSYDVTVSKLTLARPPRSFEISFSFRKSRSTTDDQITKCPVLFR